MELRDLLVTPIILVLVYAGAYFTRPYFTDQTTRRYFVPALSLKIVGAIALGFIYQFYYDGGDTFNYHSHGSRHVWTAFIDSPSVGLQMLFGDNTDISGNVYQYASRIPFFTDSNSYFVVRLAAFCDLLTASTYSATAVFFAVFSFFGSWLLFVTFYTKYPALHKQIAWSCLFIPSVVFWGSGILKDTVVLSCIGILTFEVDRLFNLRKWSVVHVIVFLVAIYFIFSIKKFVLQAFLPCAILWIYLSNLRKIRSVVLKIVVIPLSLALILMGAYWSAVKVGEGDKKYSIDKIAETARITAYDIRYYTGKGAGSGYELGELDGSIGSLLKLSPAAVNVSLFRPYVWEVRNPLMLITAIESSIFLCAVIYLLMKQRTRIFTTLSNPEVAFCLTFTIVFAFAVGVSTFNFGTLARYKIPLLPFFAIALFLLHFNPKEKENSHH